MVIRREQIAVLNRAANAVFVKHLGGYIRERHAGTMVRLPDGELPAAEIPDARLEALVQNGIERAGSYGLRWRSALASFVVTMFVAAPNFDQDAAVHELLTDKDIEPDYRMDSVLDRVTDGHWNRIRQTYDVKAWGL